MMIKMTRKRQSTKAKFHAIRVPHELMERAVLRLEKDVDMKNAGLSMTAVIKVLIAEALQVRETRERMNRN